MGIGDTLSVSVLRPILFCVKKALCKFPMKNPRAGRDSRHGIQPHRGAAGGPTRSLLSICARRSLKKQYLRRYRGRSAGCQLVLIHFSWSFTSAIHPPAWRQGTSAGAAINPAGGSSLWGMERFFRVFSLFTAFFGRRAGVLFAAK
jgi:hypothetical protein